MRLVLDSAPLIRLCLHHKHHLQLWQDERGQEPGVQTRVRHHGLVLHHLSLQLHRGQDGDVRGHEVSVVMNSKILPKTEY